MIDASGGCAEEPRQNGRHLKRRPRRSGIAAFAVAALAAIVAFFAATALASGGAATVGSALNSEVGKRVVVNPQGRTLYALSPETTHHLLCASAACLKVWPPLIVHSPKTKLKAGPGVHGHLGILRRSDGRLQITLRGRPLYRFSGDSAKGEANGEGLEGFGGTWHAATAAESSTSTPVAPAPTPTTPTTPMTPPETPGYGY